MATDALISLQTRQTVTATANGTAIILAGGTPRRGLNCRVIYDQATNVSGSNSVVFGVGISYDAGVSWNLDFLAPPIALSTTAQAGELSIPFSVSPTSVANGTQVRLTATISGAGSTPSIRYGGELALARP